MRIWAVLIGVLIMGSGCERVSVTQHQPVLANQSVAMERVVSPYVAARDFMGVVGTQRSNEPPMIYAYGFASVEQGAPHTADSIFMIGSISKQITAAAILLLEQDGKLNTSDQVSMHLPSFDHADAITIEQLLTHTSGVADVYSLKSYGISHGQADDFEAVIRELGEQPLAPAPGTSFLYSNGGYSVLAGIIESVSGMSFGEFLRQRIFVPLQMHNSSHHARGPVVRNRVSGYDPWGADALTPALPVSAAYMKGSGSIWSTAADMLAWSQGLHGGKLLNAEQYAKLTRDYGNSYGFGVSVFRRFGRDTIGHDGRVAGFSSDLAYYVEDETSVVVLSNVQSVSRDWIREQVAATIFAEALASPTPVAYTSPPEFLGAYEGAYSFGPGFTVYIEVFDGQRLMARANEGGWSELVPIDGGLWFSRMLYATVRFAQDDEGQVARLVWGAGENAPVGVRQPDN